ncbi:MAG TPA: TlpA disulfide reductase family protein [Candidatus Angelobacter sp.]|nr:TlpA disulfide reductase family protein [Candidatus Angelobacter sp.]
MKSTPRRSLSLPFLFAALAVCLSAASVSSERQASERQPSQQRPSEQQPEAAALLRQVGKTYRDLKSYEIRAWISDDQRWPDAHSLSESAEILAQAPSDKFRRESKAFMGGMEVSDGKTTWTYWGMGHQYTKKPVVPADEALAAKSNQESGMLPTNYMARYRELADDAASVHTVREEDFSIQDKVAHCSVVEVTFKPELKMDSPHRLWIDHATSLVFKEEWDEDRNFMGTAIKTHTSITYPFIRINQPVDESLFAFTPPAGSREVEELSLPGMKPKAAAPQEKNQENGERGPTQAFTLTALDGKKISLGDFKGKTVLLDFWATWCLPCRESAPIIEKINEEFKSKGLVVLGVDYGEEKKAVQGYLLHNPSSLPTLLDDGNAVAEQYGVSAIPSVILISKEGKVAYTESGFEPEGERRLRAALRKEGFGD